ncbi:MAG: CHAT domain-containing protein [Nostoc sp.]|uniref:CHAT domain-containing protein n=1 Tax=Nostoc sp. TaxID=1180 RepID=UPI002FF9E10D
MSPSNSSSENNFNITGSSITNLTGSGNIYYNNATSQSGQQNIGDSDSQKLPAPASIITSAIKTILFLAANPKGSPQLRLDEEVREIDAGLQRTQRSDQFVLKQRWAVRPRDIQRAMLDYQPQIIHFSGHGAGVEGLVLENETGKTQLVDTAALSGLFELFCDQVECVVLNACYSQTQAEAIAQYIPYVIGMSKEIGDQAAIEFAVGFYDAIGAGKSVEFAYKLGCNTISMSGIAEHLTPVLRKKST